MFPSFCLSAALRRSVLKKSQRETLCNVCLCSLLKLFLGQHPSLKTTGAGPILRPQKRVPNLLGRTQAGWLRQVSPSPALVSPCHALDGVSSQASLLCVRHARSLGWGLLLLRVCVIGCLNVGGLGSPLTSFVFHGLTSRAGHLRHSSLWGLYGRNG